MRQPPPDPICVFNDEATHIIGVLHEEHSSVTCLATGRWFGGRLPFPCRRSGEARRALTEYSAHLGAKMHPFATRGDAPGYARYQGAFNTPVAIPGTPPPLDTTQQFRLLTGTGLAQALALATGCPVIALTFGGYDGSAEGIVRAAPYLAGWDTLMQATCEGGAYVICANACVQDELYTQTVGDDGPTATNAYNGPARVGALTINADGATQNENT